MIYDKTFSTQAQLVNCKSCGHYGKGHENQSTIINHKCNWCMCSWLWLIGSEDTQLFCVINYVFTTKASVQCNLFTDLALPLQSVTG